MQLLILVNAKWDTMMMELKNVNRVIILANHAFPLNNAVVVLLLLIEYMNLNYLLVIVNLITMILE